MVGSTRPSSCATAAPGEASTTSSWPPWNGSTGSTADGSTTTTSARERLLRDQSAHQQRPSRLPGVDSDALGGALRGVGDRRAVGSVVDDDRPQGLAVGDQRVGRSRERGSGDGVGDGYRIASTVPPGWSQGAASGPVTALVPDAEDLPGGGRPVAGPSACSVLGWFGSVGGGGAGPAVRTRDSTPGPASFFAGPAAAGEDTTTTAGGVCSIERGGGCRRR